MNRLSRTISDERLSLGAVIVLAVICSVATGTNHGLPGPLRAVFAVPLVLLLPGYALVCAAKPASTMRSGQRLMLSGALSISTAVICGLLFDQTKRGITQPRWALALGGITVVAAAAAIFQRRRLNADAAAMPTPRPTQGTIRTQTQTQTETETETETTTRRSGRNLGMGMANALALVLALAIGVVAVVVARHSALNQQQPERFTALWMLPSPGYVVDIGISSHEQKSQTFTLTLSAGPNLLERWAPIVISPGQTWRTSVTLSNSERAGGPIGAQLYLAGSSVVYRHVQLPVAELNPG